MRTKLLRPLDNKVFYQITLKCVGSERTLTEWAVDDAQLFREELKRCYEDLITVVVDQVFLEYPFPPRRPTGVPDASTSDEHTVE